MTSLLTIACMIACAAAQGVRPRLILTAERIATLQQAIATNDDAAAFYNGTLAQGEYLLTVPPYSVPPFNSTGDARYALQRIYTLGLLYVLTGNATWGARGAAELLNTASWSCFDTGGSVQLNTGETLHALGIGLDWLYNALNSTSRAMVVHAIVQTGLANVSLAYAPSPPPWAAAFVNTTSNWNMVINGGTLIACLAVQGEVGVPGWVMGTLFPAASGMIAQSIAGFAPDGGWQEGPNYAGYTTRYFTPTAEALRSAMGVDIYAARGVDGADSFALHSLAPSEQDYYWGDAHCVPETRSQHLGLAGHFNHSGVAYAIRRFVRAVYESPDTTETTAMNYPVALLYFTPIGTVEDLLALPTHAHFAAQHMFYWRSSWVDANATYIGWRGLNVSWAWAHNHLDGGAFVYQAQQQWFAQDLGNDNYNIPQYFSPSRFQLYRINSSGHNTLTFDGGNQQCEVTGKYSSNCAVSAMTVLNVSSADAPLEGGVDAFAVVDLSAAWNRTGLTRVQRGFVAMGNGSTLVVVDEVDAPPGRTRVSNLEWRMHTVTNISAGDTANSIVMSMPNVTIPVVLAIQSSSNCAGATISVIPVLLPASNLPCPQCKRVQITARVTTCTRLIVTLTQGSSAVVLPSVQPLNEWETVGPFGAAS